MLKMQAVLFCFLNSCYGLRTQFISDVMIFGALRFVTEQITEHFLSYMQIWENGKLVC